HCATSKSKNKTHVRSFSAGRDIFREHKTVNKRCSFEYSSKYIQRSFSCVRTTNKRDLKHSSALTTAERYAEDISNCLRKTKSTVNIPQTISERSVDNNFVPLYRVRSQKEITQDVKPLVTEMFACFECRQTFSNFSKLRVHFHSRHYCFVCCRFFVKSSCLLKHNKTAHIDKFSCVICKDHSTPFASPESLLIHCSLKHPKQFQIHCPICGFEERCKPKPTEMMVHVRKHMRRDAVTFQKRNSLQIGCSLEIVITLVPQWSRTPRGLLTSLTVDYSMPRKSASLSQE
ncbi:Zinc finger C2H2-type, partial [Trinorchestia longiramus]